MGIDYSIDSEAQIVRLRYGDSFTADELTATLREVFRSPSYSPGFGFLADARDAPAPNAAYVDAIIAFFVRHRDQLIGGRWALVVSSPAAFGMARMRQTLSDVRQDPMPVHVFTEIAAGEAWLRQSAPGG